MLIAMVKNSPYSEALMNWTLAKQRGDDKAARVAAKQLDDMMPALHRADKLMVRMNLIFYGVIITIIFLMLWLIVR